LLRPPYKFYKDLHIYSIDTSNLKLNDPDLIGIWKDEDTSLIFFHKEKKSLIESLSKKYNFKILYYTKIPYFEWESGKYIKEFSIGDISIKPIWEYNKNSESIYIDPSVAFGSGFHPTTRMIMESFYDNFNVNRDICSAIDLGCGTGILSIFASKLGVKNIVAVDNNELAVEVTKKNLKLNKIMNVKVYLDDIFNHLPYNFEVIFGNLYYNLFEKLFTLEDFWKGKYYFLSGFIKEMEEKLMRLIPENVNLIEKREKDSWVMLFLKRSV